MGNSNLYTVPVLIIFLYRVPGIYVTRNIPLKMGKNTVLPSTKMCRILKRKRRMRKGKKTDTVHDTRISG